ncbi:ATP-dependent nuclease [Empedobacter falsenii]
MYISEIKVKNFKAFKELTFQTNSNFNVIIGENNIGKSTIFEALLLWEICYNKTVNARKNGFYKAEGKNSYIPFNELTFLRLINDTDIFFERPNVCRITLKINVNNQVFTLAFEIGKPKSINNSYLRYKTISNREFENFASHMRVRRIALDKIFFFYQTKPISNILSKEPFMNKGQILRKISIGKSGEVLRNKIINRKGAEREKIENQISNVLGYHIKFQCNNEEKFNEDEYINLKINNLDIHLQGSGFLQIAEIFSTIEYLENSINVLLIDEPDSHIHSKLQKKLLTELKSIERTQTFIISHNDNFVNELQPEELFYINSEAKSRGTILKLEPENFDKIKKEMGGVILALDKLNYSDKICFVEGEDDITYFENLKNIFKTVLPEFNLPKKVAFYYLRGKDNLLTKIEYQKRFLTQLFTDKQTIVVYDKDYCTTEKSLSHNLQITRKLGRNSDAYFHNGYCIESILFSELEILSNFLIKTFWTNDLRTDLFIREYVENIDSSFKNVNNQLYIDFESKFDSQKNGYRKDLDDVTFNDFIRDVYDISFSPQYLFNKTLIKDFYKKFIIHFNLEILFEDNSAEFYSSDLFIKYINFIENEDDIYESLKTLLQKIYN